jgi:hypothetical protein
MSARVRRIPWGGAGFVLGLVSLFVSLGGASWAASLLDGKRLKRGSVTNTKLAADAVTTAKIRGGGVTGSDVRNGAITFNDLSGSVRGAFGVGDRSITTAKLADNSVTGAKIGDGAVEGDEVRDGSLGAADLGPDSVGSPEIAPGAVTSTQLGRNAVRGSGIHASGTAFLNFGALAAGTCALQLISPPAGSQLSGDVVWATPDAFFGGNVTYSVKTEGPGAIYVKLCNVSNADNPNPDGNGGTWRWAALQITG